MPEYTVERESQVCRVALGGALTADSVPGLRSALKTELGRGAAEVIFDFERTRLLDASGLGLLVATHNSLAPRQGRMRVERVSDDLIRLLQNLRLVQRLNVTARIAS